jgi:hypothetical protein
MESVGQITYRRHETFPDRIMILLFVAERIVARAAVHLTRISAVQP